MGFWCEVNFTDFWWLGQKTRPEVGGRCQKKQLWELLICSVSSLHKWKPKTCSSDQKMLTTCTPTLNIICLMNSQHATLRNVLSLNNSEQIVSGHVINVAIMVC